MSEGHDSHAKRFIVIIIAVVIALVLSPLILQSIKAANASGNITGTLATVVNLVPLFYYLAVALIVIGDVYVFLKAYKQTMDLKTILRGGLTGLARAVSRVSVFVGLRASGA